MTIIYIIKKVKVCHSLIMLRDGRRRSSRLNVLFSYECGLAPVPETLEVAEESERSEGLRIPILPRNDLDAGGLTACCCDVPGIGSRTEAPPPTRKDGERPEETYFGSKMRRKHRVQARQQ